MKMSLPHQSSLVICAAAHVPAFVRLLQEGVHPADFWQPAEEGKMTMADVRSLNLFAHRSPVGPGKIALIPGADTLKLEVANGLLKLLEEPPAFLKIVVTAESERLLPTLRSRLHLMAKPEEFATMESPWSEVLRGFDVQAPQGRKKLQEFLYLYPLLHGGIKGDDLQASLQLQQKSVS